MFKCWYFDDSTILSIFGFKSVVLKMQHIHPFEIKTNGDVGAGGGEG